MATTDGSSSAPPPGCLLLAFCLAVMGAAATAPGAAAAAAAATAGADTSRHHSLAARKGAGAGSSAIAERRSERGNLIFWRRTAADRNLTCRGGGEGGGGAGSPYVVVFVFSGRRNRMRLLLKYLDRLLLTGKLNEVHLWDSAENDEDKKFILDQEVRDGYNIKRDSSWSEAYAFYGPGGGFEPHCEGATPNSTVLVKSDDDVVFLDVDRFPSFTQFVREHPEMFLVQANVVNNAVAVYLQGQHNKKHSAAYRGGATVPTEPDINATQLHQMFTENPSEFSWEDPKANNCIVYRYPDTRFQDPEGPEQNRFSINFFGARHAAFDEVVRLVNAYSDDEDALTIKGTREGLKECMFTPFNVAHLSFMTQRVPDSILRLYEKLLEKRQEEWQQRGERRPQRDANGQQQQQDHEHQQQQSVTQAPDSSDQPTQEESGDVARGRRSYTKL